MEIGLIGGKKLKVSLSARELEGLSMSFEALARADGNTRSFLVKLLEEGKGRTGFSPRGAKLFVEIYPDNGGGAVVYFTAFHPPGAPGLPARIQPVIFAFESAEHLLEGAARLARQYGQRVYKSSLYRFRGEFRLILYPLDYSDGLSVYFLCEYARKVGEGPVLASYIDEHGTEIIRNDAIDTLSEIYAG